MTVGGVLLVYAVTVGTLGLIAFQRAAWPDPHPTTRDRRLPRRLLVGAGRAGPGRCSPRRADDRAGWRSQRDDRRLHHAAAHRLRHSRRGAGRRARAGGQRAVLLVRLRAHRRAAQVVPDPAAGATAGRAGPAGRSPAAGARCGGGRRRARQPRSASAGGRPTVVLTSAALEVLSDDELQAVLAHERAHLAHRHHRLLTVGRRAAQGVAAAAVAARGARRSWAGSSRCTPTTTRRSGTTRGCWRAPSCCSRRPRRPRCSEPVLAAAATDVLARMHRLLAPAPPLAAANRRLAVLAAVALALLPLLFAVTPAFVALAQGRITAQ